MFGILEQFDFGVAIFDFNTNEVYRNQKLRLYLRDNLVQHDILDIPILKIDKQSQRLIYGHSKINNPKISINLVSRLYDSVSVLDNRRKSGDVFFKTIKDIVKDLLTFRDKQDLRGKYVKCLKFDGVAESVSIKISLIASPDERYYCCVCF